MDRPFSSPSGRDDAPQVIFATLLRRSQIGHCQRPSAIWLRALPADSPPALHATMLRLTPQRDILHRKVADLRSARRGPSRGGMTRLWFCLRHCRGTRDLVTHSTTARLGSGDSPPALHATMLRLTPQRDILHRKVADLRSARRGPYRGGMTRPKLYLRHCRVARK